MWLFDFAAGIRRAETGTIRARAPPRPRFHVLIAGMVAAMSPNNPECSRPSSFVKEMNDDVRHKSHPVADAAHLVLVGGRDEGPIDEHRAADHVFARNEAPVAAVVADVAIVAHGKQTVWRNYDVPTLEVGGQFLSPLFIPYSVHFGGRHGGKIVAVGIVISHFVLGVRLNQLFAVAIADAVAQVNVVTGNANDAFHYEESLLLGRQEYHDIVAARFAIRQQRPHPMGGFGELLAVDEYVVADEQGILH